jgi:thioredoxin-related protein
MQRLKLCVLFCSISLYCFAQKQSPGVQKLKWMTLIEASDNLIKEKRPVLIDLYTDWCSWCKVMDKKTYSDKKVSEYLQLKFYPVKINAESRQPISWNGKNYAFNTSYKTNDFALYLTNGQLSYPTTIIIPADGSDPQAIPGYLEPKDLEMIVKYFGEGLYRKVPFTTYQKEFKSSW